MQEVASNPLSYSEPVFRSYGDHFQSTLNRGNSKTAQYWAIYLEMMQMQTMTHTAVQENNLDMRLQAWANWIPFYFSTNLFNYAFIEHFTWKR